MPATNLSRPIVAGIVTSLVGFTSSFAVVLTGLDAVGASPSQAASGLMALCVTLGISSIVMSWTTRMPITAAWSTPGAALLAATGTIEGSWSAAVGAFLLVALLIVLTGLLPQLGALIARIPTPIAQAMLAGVLLPLCVAPFAGIVLNPSGVIPVLVTWLVFARLAPRLAVPLAFVAATIVVIVSMVGSGTAVPLELLVPVIELTTPTLTIGAVVGVALPLYIVTMASQNVPGVAVMRSFGYQVPWRRAMLVTGIGTAVGAPAGAHAINLAAISAALAAGPDAGPDRDRRWIAGVSSGAFYMVLAASASIFAALVVLAPVAVIPAVAGLALLAAFGSAVHQAIDDAGERIPAVVTFLVAASGFSIFGVSAAFWALAVGLLTRFVLGVGRR